MKNCADVTAMSLTNMVAAIAEGEMSPSAIAASCVTRIEACEPDVRAWEHIDVESICAKAASADKSAAKGDLHGMLIGIKDVIDTHDMPTGYGSKFYEGFQPAAPAACVSRLLEAGAIIAGKTVTTEFASVAPAVTRNPHNFDHTPGGSSSGSAAAVAAGMVPVALGTQTAGSVVRPAAYCGVVGYKPSFGLIDRTGVKTLAQSFDTVGTFAHSVADVALVTSILAARPALRTPVLDRKARVGVFLPPWRHLGASYVFEVVEHVGAVLRDAGESVADVAVIDGFEMLLDAQEAVMDWDMTQALSYELDHGADRLHPVTREALTKRRERASPERVAYGKVHIEHTLACLSQALQSIDALLVPSAPGEAPAGHHATGSSDFNRGWTCLGVPCLTIPVGTGPTGLPLGVQIIAARGADATLLAVASRVEAALREQRFRV